MQRPSLVVVAPVPGDASLGRPETACHFGFTASAGVKSNHARGEFAMSVAIDTARDLGSGATTVRLDGELTSASAPAVRSALDTCASERPTAVIVDLTTLDVGHAALLAVFADASERAAGQWGVPVLPCCARPTLVRKIRVFRAFPEVYGTRAEAMDAVRGRVLPRRQQRFPPTPGSAALARHLVGTACVEWNLASLRRPAMLVASELASNAIEHAGTELDVSVAFTGVKARIRSIYRKLGVSRRRDAVVRAIELGLLQ
jgi:anti-anti-sigma regulatory factor